MFIGSLIQIKKHFDFLKQDGFSGPNNHESSDTSSINYVKETIIIHIVFTGRYWCYIYKTKRPIDSILTGQTNVESIPRNEIIACHEISKLDSKRRIWNSVLMDNFPDKPLWYYSKLINQNIEILKGDFRKFSFLYRLFH